VFTAVAGIESAQELRKALQKKHRAEPHGAFFLKFLSLLPTPSLQFGQPM
jgi:hypothetical protein